MAPALMWRRILIVLFLGYATIWTALLLVPDVSQIWFIPSDLPNQMAESSLPMDKIVHASGYLMLTALAIAAFGRRPPAVPLRYLAVAAALHGMATEIAQHFIPMRSADVLDWCADVVGVTVATVIAVGYRRFTDTN
jgi:VanZ family protein